MGARLIGLEMGKAIVDAWFEAEFEGGRHTGRIEKISNYEK
jgi:ribose 5-phosphate isomerase B